MSEEIKVQSKNKKTKLIIAIAAVVIVVLTIVVIVLTSSNSATAKQVKAQLSLGEKYLSELQYEQAIAAYELAIEIDLKCEEAYLGLAEVYMATGDLGKAKDILDEAEESLGKETEGIEALREKLKENEEKVSTNVQKPTGSGVQTQDGTPTSTESVVQPPNGTPMPDAPKMVNGVFKLQTTLDGAEAEAEYFKVTQNDITGEIRIALSGVSIQDSYVTNKSTSGENYLEYGWHVKAVAENYKYEVSVSSWASNPGQEMSRKVSEMQHSIWEYNSEERRWCSIGWTAVEYTAESLTWIFTMPEGYTLDIREIEEYEIGITEDCYTTEIRRYTLSTEETMTPSSVLLPSPTLQPTEAPTPSPTPQPAKRISSNDIYIGATISYGCYEQDANSDNGAEPIEWVVLDVQEGKALVISKLVLDYQRYNNNGFTLWEECSLRKWLNTTFLQDAFSESEQEYILFSTIEGEAGSTDDKVFLLSLKETEKYFSTKNERMTGASENAIKQGAMISTKKEYKGCTDWWLRDTEYIRAYDGSNSSMGSLYNHCGVRPAIWIDIEQEEPPELADVFKSDNIWIGKGIRFGNYEQDNSADNGTEQIEWVVTDIQDGKALLVSRLGLDARPYHSSREELTWENCDLRKWLNNYFYESAFSDKEKEYILLTELDNVTETDYWYFKGEGGDSTHDSVFLLSIDEVLNYGVPIQTKPTEYALKQGAYVSKHYGFDYCIWWTRSSAYCPNGIFSRPEYLHAAYYRIENTPYAQYADGYDFVYEEGEVYKLPCIRPAIWVKVIP